jgi:hypothetical protein
VRTLFGFILGVIVTIAAAYAYDSGTGRSINGLASDAAAGQAPVVNWNVVSNHWNHFQDKVRVQAGRLEDSLKRHTG